MSQLKCGIILKPVIMILSKKILEYVKGKPNELCKAESHLKNYRVSYSILFFLFH